MVLNPEVVRKAQEELDRVVGKDRLPDFSDREDLVYIDAVVKELLRWAPPLPICLPNKLTQDDVYRGYFIPAGAMVIQNIWAILRDPTTYPNPEAFNPDRFLKDGKIDPLVFNPEDRIFGTGRREDFTVCLPLVVVVNPTCKSLGSAPVKALPSAHCILSSPAYFPCLTLDLPWMVMEIRKCPKLNLGAFSLGRCPTQRSTHPVALTVKLPYTRDPKPFKCTIKPRSEHAIKLVEETRDRAGC